MTRYPNIQPDWRFENRQVDLINEGIDAAIGGGIELARGVVARELARPHMVLVASPQFLADKKLPKTLADVSSWDAIVRRSSNTGRIQPWQLRDKQNEQMLLEPKARLILNDPEAICEATLLGLGAALLPTPHAMKYLQDGSLVRLLPKWYSDVGPLSIYFASSKLLPAKTRAFVDFIVEHFRREELAKKFSAI
jgi:DNA-binding transcriptional LysR family regulator